MILEGTTSSGAVVPVQVTTDGKVVAEGQQGPEGPQGPPGADGGSFALPPNPKQGQHLGWQDGALAWITPPIPWPRPGTGINWTSRTSAADNNWRSVCWSAEVGLFVAVSYNGSGNRVMTSPDGVNWTSRTPAADNNWMSVCWSAEAGLFVAVSNNGSGDRVMTSL